MDQNGGSEAGGGGGEGEEEGGVACPTTHFIAAPGLCGVGWHMIKAHAHNAFSLPLNDMLVCLCITYVAILTDTKISKKYTLLYNIVYPSYVIHTRIR